MMQVLLTIYFKCNQKWLGAHEVVYWYLFEKLTNKSIAYEEKAECDVPNDTRKINHLPVLMSALNLMYRAGGREGGQGSHINSVQDKSFWANMNHVMVSILLLLNLPLGCPHEPIMVPPWLSWLQVPLQL